MPQDPSIRNAFIDAAGEACGTVTPVIKKALVPLPAGEVLEVLTDDPATRLGVPAWCRLTGHELLESVVDGDQRTRFWIRKVPRPTQPV